VVAQPMQQMDNSQSLVPVNVNATQPVQTVVAQPVQMGAQPVQVDPNVMNAHDTMKLKLDTMENDLQEQSRKNEMAHEIEMADHK
jgi:hypothetical protein